MAAGHTGAGHTAGGRVAGLAAWAHGLRLADCPEEVVSLARAQRRSVLGAIAASAHDPASQRVLRAVRANASSGPVPLPDGGEGVSVEDALYLLAAWSAALDFDDYCCFAHTGHSAVLVPLLLASVTGASGSDQLVAQIAANEVAARIGGACLLGPQNGQLWSFVHAAGAAVAAGLLLGCSEAELAHGLAIALAQPPRATVAGFMEPDSKLLIASEPILMGLRAARLAKVGLTGPLGALDDGPHGFLPAFAAAPLPGMLLANLGRGWATATLCVKAYPGCAYLDTALDALLSLPLDGPEKIASIEVAAGATTTGMDALSRPYLPGAGSTPTPVTVSFSLPWSIALATVAGRLTPEEISPSWMESHSDLLHRIVQRIQLVHDPGATATALAAFGALAPMDLVRKEAGLMGLARVGSALRRSGTAMGLGEILPRGLDDLRASRRLAGQVLARPLLRDRSTEFYDPKAIETFRMSFPARVTVRHEDGSISSAEVTVPRGAAGCTDPGGGAEVVSREKLATWGPFLWGRAGTERIVSALDVDESRCWELLGEVSSS